jgi:hypothetical protein
LAGKQRTFGKLCNSGLQLLPGEGLKLPCTRLGSLRTGGQERDRTSTFAADFIEESKIVSLAHRQRSSDEVPLQILREQPCEKWSAGSPVESFFAEWEGYRKRDGIRFRQPVPSVSKPEAARVVLLEEPDALGVKKNVEESAHSDSAEGSATESRSPKVARTFRQRPIWQVSLPFSKSLMKRTPVPLAKAKSGCLSFS